MLNVSINITERNPRLRTAKGTAVIKDKGQKPLTVTFEATPFQLCIKGAGGDRLMQRGCPGGLATLYGEVGGACIDLYCHMQQAQLNEALEEAEGMVENARTRVMEKLREFE